MDRKVTNTRAPDRLELDEPNAVLLPGIDERSRRAPAAGFAVLRAYKNGLALTDGASLIEGYGAAFGTLGLLVAAFGIFVGLSLPSTFISVGGTVFLALFCVFPALVYVLRDCTGYREQPTLFDRGVS